MKLSEIIDFNPSRSIKKGKNAPFVEMAALSQDSRDITYIFRKEFNGSGTKFKNGDTLFARITPCLENGKTAKVNCLKPGELGHGSTEFIVLKAKKPEFDEDFIYYLCRWSKFRDYAIGRMEGTSGRQRVDWKAISEFECELPEKEERKKIGFLLKQLDDIIANNNRINQTLDAMVQALFKSWFVDFDPVKAKIEAKELGEDPDLAAMMVISGKTVIEMQNFASPKHAELRATANLFPDQIEESDLGLIPKGWKWTAFGELLEKTVGGDWGQDEPDEKHTEEVRIIRGTDISTLQSGKLNKVPIRFVEPQKLKIRKLQKGDIVIEISGGSKDQPTGRSIYLTQNIIDRLGGIAEPASFCRLFRPEIEEIGAMLGQHLQYIYSVGKTWLYQNQSTGISNFQTTTFLEREFLPIPDLKVIKAFYMHIKPILEKTTSNENMILAEIRDSILPKLLSGELILNEN